MRDDAGSNASKMPARKPFNGAISSAFASSRSTPNNAMARNTGGTFSQPTSDSV
jgi:hypothetical protein